MKKFSVYTIKPAKPRLFKIRWGSDRRVFIVRLDIIGKTVIFIYRKKGFQDWLDEISYGYL